MKKYVGGKTVEFTPEEYEVWKLRAEKAEAEYWQSISYDEAVDAEIRKRYTVSQEFAILRQRDEKPEEYAAYYAYCEQCKAYVKGKKAEVVADGS